MKKEVTYQFGFAVHFNEAQGISQRTQSLPYLMFSQIKLHGLKIVPKELSFVCPMCFIKSDTSAPIPANTAQ